MTITPQGRLPPEHAAVEHAVLDHEPPDHAALGRAWLHLARGRRLSSASRVRVLPAFELRGAQPGTADRMRM